jgi:preprotein translocase subunit SecE
MAGTIGVVVLVMIMTAVLSGVDLILSQLIRLVLP